MHPDKRKRAKGVFQERDKHSPTKTRTHRWGNVAFVVPVWSSSWLKYCVTGGSPRWNAESAASLHAPTNIKLTHTKQANSLVTHCSSCSERMRHADPPLAYSGIEESAFTEVSASAVMANAGRKSIVGVFWRLRNQAVPGTDADSEK